MKALRMMNAIQKLVSLADKEIYYRNNDLQLRFSSEDSVYVVGTREDGSVYLSVYFGFEMDFKFYFEKDGTLLTEEGSTPNLLEYSGLEQVLNLINNAGDALLAFGIEAIESGDYEFKTMEQVREEFGRIRTSDRKKDDDPETH